MRTKLNTGETDVLDELDDLDAVYVKELQSSGINDDLLTQFLNISKELENSKEDK